MKKYRLRQQEHDDLIDDLLAARGIGAGERVSFLAPDFERDSHDPFLMPGMEEGVRRIMFARENDEKVAVWSDYDCDGIPGGVMLTEFLRSIGMSVVHYIPHRNNDGFGLNNEGLAELSAQNIKLIITVDLGTTDVSPVAFAKEKGMDVVITDHHLAPPVLPDAVAIINPKLPGSSYPYDMLCGAGVAWKLVQAIVQRYGKTLAYQEGQEKWLLDMVALGTLTDMVPLRNENRMLAHFGLKVLRRARRPGVQRLLELLKIAPASLTEDDIGFMVAPRINAASRMDNPHIAARLLASSDGKEAYELAVALNTINDERKGAVASVVKEVNKRLKEFPESQLIVMGNPNWRPGILGLVANSLVEATGKTVFLWGRENGTKVRGSCRSEQINIVELMQGAADLFEDFGGHHGAGGFALLQEKVHELHTRLEASYAALASRGLQSPEEIIDRRLELSEIPYAHKQLKQLAPFGVEHEKPLFLLPHVTIASVRNFGKVKNHLEAVFTKNDTRVPGIAFFATPDSFQKGLTAGTRADVVAHVEEDWRGGSRVRIVDVL